MCSCVVLTDRAVEDTIPVSRISSLGKDRDDRIPRHIEPDSVFELRHVKKNGSLVSRTLQDKVLRRILASCTKLDRYREMLTDVSHSDLKAESEYLSLLISSLDEPSDDTQTLSNSQLAKYVVFECVYISHYHENITSVINLYYKEITRTPTLECALECLSLIHISEPTRPY